MSVVTLVKDLIGKEDVNWGDSSSTFSRETHTGGSTSISYIDAEIIPSTGLGGYIGDHLHWANADTGTTQSTFKIDSDDNYAELSASGLTGDRTYTFPDSSQALVGGTDLASTANGKGASDVGVEDSGDLFDSTDVEAVLAEAGTSIQANSSISMLKGFLRGGVLTDNSNTEVIINLSAHLGGNNDERMVSTEGNVTFEIGPTGSNADSDAVGTSQLQYICIDGSSVSSNTLTAASFINKTTAPAFDNTEGSWYVGSYDRCVGAVYIESGGNILDFFLRDGTWCIYSASQAVTEEGLLAAATLVDVSEFVPSFAHIARYEMTVNTGDTGVSLGYTNSDAAEFKYLLTQDIATIVEGPSNMAEAFYLSASTTNNAGLSVSGFSVRGLNSTY